MNQQLVQRGLADVSTDGSSCGREDEREETASLISVPLSDQKLRELSTYLYYFHILRCFLTV